MKEFIKTFPYETCESCARTYGKSRICKSCDGENNYYELYDADPNCVHELLYGNGVRCVKCSGWFCF